MAIEAIFFDAAGTLIDPVRPVAETYAAMAINHGVNAPVAEISQRFYHCFRSAPALAFPGIDPRDRLGRERDWWKALVYNVFEPWQPFPGFEQYFSELFDYFAQPSSWRLYPEVSQTLTALTEMGVALAVISNFDSRLSRILDGLGIQHQFRDIILSSHVGYAKPATEIFATGLNRLGVQPASAIHVGDSRENDLEGALNAGLTAILLERKEPEAKPVSSSLLCIRDLRELVPIVTSLGLKS